MTFYPILLLAGVVADAWLAAYGLLRLRRTLAKLAFVALLVDFVVMTSAFAGIELGALDPGWAPVALWSFVLSHPLAALFLLLARQRWPRLAPLEPPCQTPFPQPRPASDAPSADR